MLDDDLYYKQVAHSERLMLLQAYKVVNHDIGQTLEPFIPEEYELLQHVNDNYNNNVQ
jgi:hypothetical protein